MARVHSCMASGQATFLATEPLNIRGLIERRTGHVIGDDQSNGATSLYASNVSRTFCCLAAPDQGIQIRSIYNAIYAYIYIYVAFPMVTLPILYE